MNTHHKFKSTIALKFVDPGNGFDCRQLANKLNLVQLIHNKSSKHMKAHILISST